MSKADKNPANNGTFRISAESNFNTIGYKVTVTATQEQVLRIASEGLSKLVGGKPSGRCDAVLGYNPAERNDVKRPDGKDKDGNPDGSPVWKRNSILFSDGNAKRLGEIFTEFLQKEGYTEVEVQTFQQGSNAAFDTAKATLAAMEAAGTAMGVEGFVAKWARDVIKYTGNDLSAANVEFLAAIAANNARLPKPAAK